MAQLPNLTGPGDASHNAQVAFRRLNTHLEDLTQKHQALVDKVNAMPAPLTLDQIQAALQAGGTNPLNLTGLQASTTAPAAGSAGGTPGPDPGPGPEPPYGSQCAPRSNHLDTVTQAKADLVAAGEDLSGSCGAFKVTSLVASRLAGSGEAAGTLKKTTGDNCSGHSVDIICYGNGALYDILINAETDNTPAWNFVGIVDDITRYEGPPCP
jgi:hypothetical protein